MGDLDARTWTVYPYLPRHYNRVWAAVAYHRESFPIPGRSSGSDRVTYGLRYLRTRVVPSAERRTDANGTGVLEGGPDP